MARDFAWIRPEPHGIHVVPADSWIDPSRPVGHALVTHGHADHARGGHGVTVATPETLAIMDLRYNTREGATPVPYGETIRLKGSVDATYIPAGHVLGSAQILLEHAGERVPEVRVRKRLPRHGADAAHLDRRIGATKFCSNPTAQFALNLPLLNWKRTPRNAYFNIGFTQVVYALHTRYFNQHVGKLWITSHFRTNTVDSDDLFFNVTFSRQRNSHENARPVARHVHVLPQLPIGNTDEVAIKGANLCYSKRDFLYSTFCPTNDAEWSKAHNVTDTKLTLRNDVQTSDDVAHHLLSTKTQTGTCHRTEKYQCGWRQIEPQEDRCSSYGNDDEIDSPAQCAKYCCAMRSRGQR